MTGQWQLRKADSGQIYSHLSFSTLKAWILEARVDPHDQVARQGTNQWVYAREVPQLVPFFAPEAIGSDVISGQDTALPWRRQEGTEEAVAFDMTPMIDVTFLLLIFFLVTASSIHTVHQIQIPKGKHAQPLKKEKITIYINRQRQIFLNQEPVALQNLQARLKAKVASIILEGVIVAADRNIDYGLFATVVDEIKGSGIKTIALDIRQVQSHR